MAAMLWLTNSTVRPLALTSRILPRHFFWNAASPTASTSSTSRMSRLEMRGDGERQPHVHAAGVALHRRVDELLDLGEGDDLVELAADLRRRMPRMAPFRKMFSRPVSSGWKPVPTSSRLPTRP